MRNDQIHACPVDRHTSQRLAAVLSVQFRDGGRSDARACAQPYEARQAAYIGAIGSDRFVQDIDAWRLVGINSQLLGSGLAAETDQHGWLAATLETDRPVALFLHYPVDLDDPADAIPSHTAIHPEARAALLALIDARPNVRLVASGHLHEARKVTRNGVVYQWAPATSFMMSEGGHGGNTGVGFHVYRFDRAEFAIERHRADWMIDHDIASWGNT